MRMDSRQPTLKDVVDEYSSMVRLAKSLGISRPSAYKYVQAYDDGHKELIPEEVLKFFDTVMISTPSGRREIFNSRYNEYLNQEEAREMENPVPREIAETIDRLGMTVEQIDARIENALRVQESLHKLGYGPENHHVQSVERDLRNLQYTRDMIERRSREIRFWPITEGDMEWFADIGGGLSYPYNEDELECKPDLAGCFKYCLLKNVDGYTLLFDSPGRSDPTVTVMISAKAANGWVEVASFSNQPGQHYVSVPKIFDSAYAYNFWYNVMMTSEKGKIINNMHRMPFSLRGHPRYARVIRWTGKN